MDFPQKLNKLINDRGITSYRVGKDTGISIRLIDYWRKGERLPGSENLKKISDYFGVTADYLLGNEEKSSISTDDELSKLLKDKKNKAVYDRLIKLSPENFDLALAQLDALISHQKKKDIK